METGHTEAFAIEPSVLIGCFALLAIYFFVLGPARSVLGGADEPQSTRRAVSWVSALVILFLALNGPLHEWSDRYLFSAHMVQHMILMLIMSPFLIAGIPPWVVRSALRVPGLTPIARGLTHPAIAFVAYNATFVLWHLPEMYGSALENHDVHILQHLNFMAVAVMMWWPVVNSVPELERVPTGPLLMGYLFLIAVPGTVVSALITLSDDVLYGFYAAAPRITELSAIDDQRLGGLIMWIPGMLIFWIAITAIFFRWTKDEYRSWKLDPEAPSPL
jgi:putative membrane protein